MGDYEIYQNGSHTGYATPDGMGGYEVYTDGEHQGHVSP